MSLLHRSLGKDVATRSSTGAVRGTALILGLLAFLPTVACGAAIAQEGLGIIGIHSAIDSTLGIPFEHAGFAANVNDGILTTSVDTFNGAGPEGFSYTGIIFPAPRTDLVTNLTLTTAAFFDGGWFGPNGTGPGAQQQLTSTFLIPPTVQITFDGGNTWVDAPASNNYVARLTGTVLPAPFGTPTRANTATFTLTTAVTGIDGIRLIGRDGGTASGGFLGVFEVGVEAIPEPSVALALFTGVGCIAAFRRQRGVRLSTE